MDGSCRAIDPSDGDLPADCSDIDARRHASSPRGWSIWRRSCASPAAKKTKRSSRRSQAALAGGYTSILRRSNTHPALIRHGAVEFVRQNAAQGRGARVHVSVCLSKGRRGDRWRNWACWSKPVRWRSVIRPRRCHSDALLKRALDYCRMFDRPIFDRPEVPELASAA